MRFRENKEPLDHVLNFTLLHSVKCLDVKWILFLINQNVSSLGIGPYINMCTYACM